MRKEAVVLRYRPKIRLDGIQNSWEKSHESLESNSEPFEEEVAHHSTVTSMNWYSVLPRGLSTTTTIHCTAQSCIYKWNEHCYSMHSVSYIKATDTKGKFINILTQNASICDIHALCWKLCTVAINCVAGALVKHFVISRGLWKHAKFTLAPKLKRQGACAALHVSRWKRMVTFSLRPRSEKMQVERDTKACPVMTTGLCMEEGIESLNILESAKIAGCEMGRVCSTHGSDKKWGENFCRKLWRDRQRSLGKSTHRWSSTNIGLREMGCGSMDWIHVA
jgi:hypothetical protein